jgi:thioredoxin reductase (NADPH)
MYDVLIIGAGAAGLSAALWCDDLGLDALVLEEREEIGGQLLWIHNPVENYLGLRAANGRELRDAFTARVEDAEFDLWTGVEIESVDLNAKRVRLRSGEELQSIFLIVATGLRRRRLDVPGEAEFEGRGMIESAARDRELFAGRDVCVVGGGDAAVENALLLSEVCATVTLVHRRKKLRARAEFVERLKGTHCITVFTEAQLLRVIGGERVEAVEIKRGSAIKSFQMAVGGVLVRIGYEPNTELFRDGLATDDGGYVVITSEQETSVDNVFAVGDVASRLAPTISGATGAGATAAKIIAARLNEATTGS